MQDFFEINRGLPQTLEPSPILDVLKKFDTTIAYASPENLQQSLPKSGFKVRSADPTVYETTPGFEKIKDSENIISTETDPAVIFIHGASFCALMLAKDNHGNAVGLHQPIEFREGRFHSMKQAVLKLRKFFTGVKTVIGDNEGLLILSGANPMLEKDDTQARLEALVEKQNKQTKLSILKLFVKPKESSYALHRQRMSPLKDFTDKLSAFSRKKQVLPDDLREINGLIYVPRQIDISGKDRIFVKDKKIDFLDIKGFLFPNLV
ncbi:MAG: hypothetical protein NTZ93_02620 [Candidatus Beckwithbacteria bacterium]|nr:hypothetical protein [Candidatus Beckwithbacteria bacterium]